MHYTRLRGTDENTSPMEKDNHGVKSIEDEADIVAKLIQTAGRRAEPPPEAYSRALEAATAAWQSKTRARRRQRRFRWAAVLAAVSISAAIVLGTLAPTSPQPVAQVERIIGILEFQEGGSGWQVVSSESEPLQFGTAVRTRTGSRAGLVFPDGLSVRIADDTEIELVSVDEIRLASGMVYVDTGADNHDQGRLRVITDAGTAEDLGTQFEVFYRDDVYRLRVREGLVVLQRGAEQIDNRLGDELIVDADGGFRKARIARDDPAWLWVESVAPAPVVDEQPITVLLDWVSRETGRQVRYSGPVVRRQAGATILHGNISHLSPLEALTVMLATTDMEYALLEDGTIMIRTKVSQPLKL